MNWNRTFKGLAVTSLSAVAAMSLSGCGSSATSGGATDLTIAGALNLSTTTAMSTQSIKPASVNFADYTILCTALKIPPVSGQAAIGADGKFSVQIAGAKGSKLGCFVVNSTTFDIAWTIQIKDTSKKDLSGNDKVDSSYAFGSDVDFGTLTVDPAKTTIDVPATQVAAATSAAAASASDVAAVAWDATGTWKISKMTDAELPKGYTQICASGAGQCDGPQDQMTIYMVQMSGKKYVNGATTTDPLYGLEMWESQAAFNACGTGGVPALGLTDAKAKAQGADFTSDPKVVAGTVTLADYNMLDWKLSGATSVWGVNNCQNITYTDGTRGWKCKDDNATSGNTADDLYQINTKGGCVDASGNPVNITDWSQVTAGSCTNGTTTHDGKTFQTNSCTNTYQAATVTCNNEWRVEDSSGATSNGTFNWAHTQLLAPGGNCSTLTGGSLDQLRCYADYYWQHKPSTGCVSEPRFDYSATTAADFVRSTDKIKARFVANFYDIDASGIGSVTQHEDDSRFVPTGNNGQGMECRTERVMTLTFTPVTRNGANVSKTLTTFKETEFLREVNSPACVANFVAQGFEKTTIGNTVQYARKVQGMFYMTKQ